MSRLGLIPAALGVLFLSACSTAPTVNDADTGSSVTALQAGDGVILAQAIVDTLRDPLPPASSTIEPVPPNPPDTQLTPILEAGLVKAGYGIAAPAAGQGRSDVHVLRYVVSPLDDGLLLRLSIDSTPVACFYTRDPQGVLQLDSPCTNRVDSP